MLPLLLCFLDQKAIIHRLLKFRLKKNYKYFFTSDAATMDDHLHIVIGCRGMGGPGRRYGYSSG